MFLSDVSIKRPVFATMLMVALLVFGLVSYTRLAIDEYPDVTYPTISVNTSFSGASPEVMERDVSRPMPFAPPVIVIQLAVVPPVQPHPAADVTVTATALPPAAATVCAAGLIATAHDPAWATVKSWPAMVAVPARELPVFADALSVTVPLPEPVVAPTNVSQGALLVAVHEQSYRAAAQRHGSAARRRPRHSLPR